MSEETTMSTTMKKTEKKSEEGKETQRNDHLLEAKRNGDGERQSNGVASDEKKDAVRNDKVDKEEREVVNNNNNKNKNNAKKSTWSSRGEDYTNRKIFIGGLPHKTNMSDLRRYFQEFGEVVYVVIPRDKDTSKSRGFGFVAFKEEYSVNDVLKSNPHTINKKSVEVKRAIPRMRSQHANRDGRSSSSVKKTASSERRSFQNRSFAESKSTKIFVGGLHSSVGQSTFESYFKKFGNVVDAVVMIDRNTKRSRGFGFITFENPDSVKKAMNAAPHELNGKLVEVKLAQPRQVLGGTQGGGRSGKQGRYYRGGGTPPGDFVSNGQHVSVPPIPLPYAGQQYAPTIPFEGYPYVGYHPYMPQPNVPYMGFMPTSPSMMMNGYGFPIPQNGIPMTDANSMNVHKHSNATASPHEGDRNEKEEKRSESEGTAITTTTDRPAVQQ